MLPPRSRFLSCQDRATESMLPKNQKLNIFWTFYQPRLLPPPLKGKDSEVSAFRDKLSLFVEISLRERLPKSLQLAVICPEAGLPSSGDWRPQVKCGWYGQMPAIIA
jgi:hypothetical protein